MQSKTLAITITTVVLGLTGAGLINDAFATPQTLQAASPVYHHCFTQRHMMAHRFHKQPAWRLGFGHNKHLTESDARTVTQAALIMQGHKNIKVGQITAKKGRYNHNLYIVNLDNAQGKMVRRVVVNGANGHIRPYFSHKTQRA